jgi:hypothetical protein
MMDTAKFPSPNLTAKQAMWKTLAHRLWNKGMDASVKYGGWLLRLFS